MEQLKIAAQQNGPLCVGLDTDISYIPPKIVEQFENPADAVIVYNREIINRVARQNLAACFKIQIAYYEALGIAGMKVFAETLHAVHKAGFISISDIKRGDIANTATAYASAHFSGDFETDIITVNPYMGFDTLKPFTEFCKPMDLGDPKTATNCGSPQASIGKGIFVLLRTSNSGAKDIEQQTVGGNNFVYDIIGKELNRLSKEFSPMYQDCSCSPIGAVVGCTDEADAKELREKYADIFFLIPGYGAQGGAARVAATLLQKAGGVINSSRGILCAWQKDESLAEKRVNDAINISDMADSAARAALAAKNDLLSAMH